MAKVDMPPNLGPAVAGLNQKVAGSIPAENTREF
jgi:hypothetical protein